MVNIRQVERSDIASAIAIDVLQIVVRKINKRRRRGPL